MLHIYSDQSSNNITWNQVVDIIYNDEMITYLYCYRFINTKIIDFNEEKLQNVSENVVHSGKKQKKYVEKEKCLK